jgi:peroxiredoxin
MQLSIPAAGFLALGAFAALAQAPPPVKTHLKVGDPAPNFSFRSTSTKEAFTLADYKGKSSVVVAFFPAAFTGG